MINETEFWASIIVDELEKNGLQFACIAAGSRSTPLTLALARSELIKSLPFIDERTAAFFGLGLAMQSKKSVVIVCTSGTALANFYPAVLEAKYSGIPLIVMSADRPHELRGSGSNQTMNQVNFFNNDVLYFKDVQIPDPFPTKLTINSIRTLMGKVMGIATNGPVHLNFPFRKPLEPIKGDRDLNLSLLSEIQINGRENSYLNYIKGTMKLDEMQVQSIWDQINNNPHGIFIVGPNSFTIKQNENLLLFAHEVGYPILADPASGLRYIQTNLDVVISNYNVIVSKIEKPRIVIKLGKEPVSKVLLDYIRNIENIITVDPDRLIDGSLGSSTFYQADIHSTILKLLEAMNKNKLMYFEERGEWLSNWVSKDQISSEAVTSFVNRHFFDGSIFHSSLSVLPSNSQIFLTNSLTIRLFDLFVPKINKDILTYHNRGLSGIDGNLSISSGISLASNNRVVVFIGDLSFYHDSNALLNLTKHGVKLTIILVNNKGGGIFHRLPISEFEPEFTKYFIVPHEINFESLVLSYGVSYKQVKSIEEYSETLSYYIETKTSNVIEVNFNSKITNDLVSEFMSNPPKF